MFGGIRRLAVLVLFALALLAPLPSHAFCGFYINTGEQPLFNDATNVVLMRAGLRTVLSIQNDYKGPIDDFALVIPVPIVLERENVRTLPPDVFDRVNRLTSPRLVEYWEQDPCAGYGETEMEGGTGTRAKGEEGSMGNRNRPLVVVERQFSVEEYDVVVLSARDSGALETWLHENNYRIPAGAEPYLRPYVQDGSKFFVAKVDINRVHFRWGRAQLSPLRFHYDTPQFTLPIRLGLINSAGVQDLIVHILGETRYETANYENVFIPTNFTVKDETRTKFNSFYAALFDQTLAEHPRAVVTEYAWSPQHCDPCPQGAGPLADEDTRLLGLDVVNPVPSTLVLTRLHTRYGKSAIGEDLVFRNAWPVYGGREPLNGESSASHDAVKSTSNSFQGRYVIRHKWEYPVDCPNPRYGVWGGPQGNAPAPPAPKANPLAPRNLKAADYILDDQSAQRAAGGGGDPGNGSLVRILKHIVTPSLWSNNDEWLAVLAAFAVSFLGAVVWSRRQRSGVVKTIGLFVAFFGFAFLVGAVSCDARLRFPVGVSRVCQHRLIVGSFVIAAMGLAAGRTPLRVLWAFVPGVAGVACVWIEWARFLSILKTDLADAELERMGRIVSEATSETFEPLVIGIAVAGALAVAAALLSLEKREAVKWPPVAIAIGAAIAARFLVDLHALDLVAVLTFAGAAVLVARANRLNDVLPAIAAVALVDVATKLLATSMGLGAVSGESVDPDQVSRILAFTIKDEQRHLLVAALDLGLLAGLTALARIPHRFVDWRVVMPAAALVLLSATAFEWVGAHRMMAGLDPAHERNDSLGGPALFVDAERKLWASPSTDAKPAPYTVLVAEKMASADTGSAPLLFGRTTGPFGDLVDALAPLLAVRQSDYRLTNGVEPPPELGAYATLVSARGVHPVRIDIQTKLGSTAPDHPEGSPLGIAFRWDGKVLRARPVQLLGAALARVNVNLGLDTVDLGRESDSFSTLEDAARRGRSTTMAPEVAFLVPRETSLSEMTRILAQIERLKATRIVVSPDVGAFDRL